MNILLITDDQHRWDFYNNQTVGNLAVPALTRLQSEGTMLTNAYSNCPICMPTRFTWTYGLYASQAAQALLRNAHDWPTHLPSMPQALQNAGYHTALVGKLHSLAGLQHRDVTAHEDETRARGFDDVFEVSGKSLSYWYDCRYTRHLAERGMLDLYRQDVARRCAQLGGHELYEPSPLAPCDHMDGVIGQAALDWLDRYKDERPFFLHASFCGPHFPLDPPRTYFDRHQPRDMPVPQGVIEPEQILKWQEQQALYCGLVELVDEQVGRLMDMLDGKGLANDTLVLFTTDHGDMMGHMDRSGKGHPSDTSCRTPVIARLPGVVPAGAVLDDMAEAVDLPCTIMAAAGCGDDEKIRSLLPNSPGRSYWSYLAGAADRHRDWVYAEHARPNWRMCRTREMKYVFRDDQPDELFNMIDDPWELENVAEDPDCADTLSRMRRLLVESMSRCVAPNILK